MNDEMLYQGTGSGGGIIAESSKIFPTRKPQATEIGGKTMQQLEEWKVSDLIEYARNPRKNDHAVDKVAAAIREFGFRVPILAKSDKTIVDGHLRLKAAKKIGIETVPVMLCDDMTDAQIKAFRISVNRVAEFADWDDELLRIELDELGELGFDIELTGFSLDEIEGMGFEDDALDEMPGLPEGDREPFQQITFTLHDEQVEQVKAAMDAAKALGPFDSPNENSNGNAIARVCEAFLTDHGNS